MNDISLTDKQAKRLATLNEAIKIYLDYMIAVTESNARWEEHFKEADE